MIMQKLKKGFTLVELVIVIAVIGILAAVLIPTFSGIINNAKDSNDKATAHNMTMTLQAEYPLGLPNGVQASDIRTIINSISDTNFNFAPTANGTKSYWYNKAKNSIEYCDGKSLLNVSADDGQRVGEEDTRSLEEVFAGYYCLDNAATSLGNILNTLRNLTSAKQYQSVETKLATLTEENSGFTIAQINAIKSHLSNFTPDNTIFVNDFSYFSDVQGAIADNILFSDNVVIVPQYSGTVTAIKNGISLPKSLMFIEENTILKSIVETGGINTSVMIMNNNIKATEEPSIIFSDYLTQRQPTLLNISTGARKNAIVVVTFDATIDPNNLEIASDGSKQMAISVRVNLPHNAYLLKSSATPEQKEGYEGVISKIQYDAMSSEDKALYDVVPVDTDKIIIQRFNYTSLDTGEILVKVKVFDEDGVLSEGNTTYYPTIKIDDLDFSDRTVLFTKPMLPNNTQEQITYKIEVLDSNGNTINNSGSGETYNASQIDKGAIVLESKLGNDYSIDNFFALLVTNEYGYKCYNQSNAVISNPSNFEANNYYLLKEVAGEPSKKISGNKITTTITNQSSNIYIEDGLIYEEYYTNTITAVETKSNGKVSVSATESHSGYVKKMTPYSLPNSYITVLNSENNIPYNTINLRVSAFIGETLVAQRQKSFGNATNPVKTLVIDQLATSNDASSYSYTYTFKDPLYYVGENVEKMMFTDKTIYLYEQDPLNANHYDFYVRGTGVYNKQGTNIIYKEGSASKTISFDASYDVVYNNTADAIELRITPNDSMYSLLSSEQSIANRSAYTKRVAYVYTADKSQLDLTNITNYTLLKVNGRDVENLGNNTYSFQFTNGEEFNPLNTIIKLTNNSQNIEVNASLFQYVKNADENIIVIPIADGKDITIQYTNNQINFEVDFANTQINNTSITVTRIGKGDVSLLNNDEVATRTFSDVNYCEQITLTANEAPQGFRFVGWMQKHEGDLILLSTKLSYVYTVGDKDECLIAEFASDHNGLLSFSTSSDKTASLTRCFDKTITTLYVPSFYDQYKVVSIGANVFQNCSSLEVIKIPSTVNTIGTDAFEGTKYLIDLKGEGGVPIIIGDYLYKYVEKDVAPESTVTIPYGVKYIMDYAFQNCIHIETIIIPDTLESIGSYAFDSCIRLKDIIVVDDGGDYATENNVLPDATTRVANYAFKGCVSLEIIDLNNAVELGVYSINVASYAKAAYYYGSVFYNCTSLATVKLPADLTIVSSALFYNCVSLKNVWISGVADASQINTLPSGVTTIAGSVFYNCTSLTEITMPSGIKSLYNYYDNILNMTTTSVITSIFNGCTSLTTVTFPEDNDYTKIAGYFFYGCSVLTEVNNLIIKNITTFGSNCFNGCNSLDLGYLVLGESGENISLSTAVFAGCSLLETIEFKSAINTANIPSSLFSNCTSLSKIILNGSFTQVLGSAFYNCTSLKTISGLNFSSLNYIGNSAFYNCIKFEFPNNLVISSINSDFSIGSSAFVNCATLVNVTINGINLLNVSGSKVYSLDNYVPQSCFQSCTSLETIVLPVNTQGAYYRAFYNCDKLMQISKCYNEGIVLGNVVLKNASNQIIAEPLPFTSIEKYSFEETNLLWANTNGDYGVQLHDNYLIKNNTLRNYNGTLAEIEIPSKFTYTLTYYESASTYTTEEHTIDNVTTTKYTYDDDGNPVAGVPVVTDAVSLTTIGKYAFRNNKYIKRIILPDSVTTIEEGAFEGCSNLEYIKLSNNLVSIGENAFKNCTKLSSITIPNSVTTIGAGAFQNSINLVGIYIAQTDSSASAISIASNSFESDSTVYFANEEVKSKYFSTVGEPAQAVYPNWYVFSENASTGTNPTESIIEDTEYMQLNYEIINETNKTARLISFVGIDGISRITNEKIDNCTSSTKAIINGTLKTIGANFNPWTYVGNGTVGTQDQVYNVIEISKHAFKNSSIQRIILPSSIQSLGEGVFFNCTILQTVTILGTITNFPSQLFYNCASLTTINKNLDGNAFEYVNLTTIGNNAFYNCKSFNPMNMTLNVEQTNFGVNVFQNCAMLRTMTFNKVFTALPNSTFQGCSNLTTVSFRAGLTSIGSYCFYNCNNLVTASNLNIANITKLGSYAFGGCINYKFGVSGENPVNIVLNSGLDTMGIAVFNNCKKINSIVISQLPSGNVLPDYSFKGCSALSSMTLPTTLVGIGDNAFEGCESLTALNLTGYTSLTTIGNNAFADCIGLQNVSFANSVSITLGVGTFRGCANLATVTLSSKITVLSDELFAYCSSLNSIDLQYITSFGKYVFRNCEALNYNTATNLFSNSLIQIGDYAFAYWTGLTGITLNSATKTLGNYVFSECENLTKLVLSGVTTLGTNIMNGCSKLTEVSLSSELIKIPDYMFSGASNLVKIDFVNNLGNIVTSNATVIGVRAFNNCLALTSLGIDFTKITLIDEYAFYNCMNLDFASTQVQPEGKSDILTLSAPSNTLTINTSVFVNCKQLKKVVFACSTLKCGSKINYFGYSMFLNCTSLTEVTLPVVQDNGTGKIEQFYSSAFQNCINLTNIYNLDLTKARYLDSNLFYNCQSLNFGDELKISSPSVNSSGLLTLNASVFYNCKLLRSVSFESTKICYSSSSNSGYLYSSNFYGCVNLTSVSFPNTDYIKYLGNSLFAYCLKLTSINNLDYTKLIYLGTSCFFDCFELNFSSSIQIGTAGVEIKVGPQAFYNCKNLQNINIAGTFLNASPQLVAAKEDEPAILMDDYSLPYSLFYGCSSLHTIKLPSALKGIGQYAFYECFYLSDITDTDGNAYNWTAVEKLGAYAFYRCFALSFNAGNMVLGNNIDYMGTDVFYANYNLQKIVFGSLYDNSIQKNTFYNCYNLKEVVLPNTIKTVKENAFYNCSALQEFNFYNITDILSSAFAGCAGLTAIELPNTLLTLGNYAFRYCLKLKEVTLPTSEYFAILPAYCFDGCISLQHLVIPTNITSIGTYAIKDCFGLTMLEFESNTAPTLTSSGSISLQSYTNVVLPDACVDATDKLTNASLYNTGTNWSSLKVQQRLIKKSEIVVIDLNFETNDFGKLILIGNTLYNYTGVATSLMFNQTSDQQKLAIVTAKIGEIQHTFNLENSIRTINRYSFVGLSALAELKINMDIMTSSSCIYDCAHILSPTMFN